MTNLRYAVTFFSPSKNAKDKKNDILFSFAFFDREQKVTAYRNSARTFMLFLIFIYNGEERQKNASSNLPIKVI